ncbi:hypothetical protein GGI07_003514 [Coemansia sp. Benny D115]|nr:hypothetical protein GGI07_003514 [Coemansia sp. Benny D115]
MKFLTFSVRDEYGVWPRIEKEFSARLPLRNLIWKGGLTQAPRFVEQLNIRVTAEADNPPTTTTSATSEPAPLVHLYLVDSDSDSDTYKSTIRPKAKSWAARVGSRRGEEWLMVYVPGAAEIQRMATTQGKFLGMRTNTFDRLRSDFQTTANTSKKKEARVVMLRTDQVESWNALFLAIRDLAVQALEERVAAMAEDIRRMDANRLLPGWNYCTFFVFKEGLIKLYRLMGLRGEALAQYDELEAVFFQLLDTHRLSWFSTFGGGQEADDFSDILNTRKKPYRAQMIDNTISLFDFRMYLFGRQCQLLLDDERYSELVARAQRFIQSFSASMREPGTGLGAVFVAAWTYSTCQNIVEICEGVQWTGASRDAAVTASLAAAKAEFLTVARRQLDVLGALSGRLPDHKQQGEGAKVSNPVLADALASDERFDQIYCRICEQATQYYVECERRRFARQLQGDVAQLLIGRRQWAKAAQVLKPLVPPQNTILGALDGLLLERLALCERELGHPRECLELCLWLLAHPQLLAVPGAQDLGDCVTVLEQQAAELTEDVRVTGEALFRACEFAAVPTGASSDSNIGTSLRVVFVVESLLSRPVQAAGLRVALAARSDSRRRFEAVFCAEACKLVPGRNRVYASTDAISCAGLFAVGSVSVLIGRAILAAGVSAGDGAVVRLSEHPQAPEMRALAVTASDGQPRLRVHVRARGSVMKGMKMRAFDASGRAIFTEHSRAICTEEEATCTMDEQLHPLVGKEDDDDGSALVFAGGLDAETTCEIDVIINNPAKYTGCVGGVSESVTLCAEYRLEEKSNIVRLAVSRDCVELAPPLQVAVRGLHAGVLQVRVRCMDTLPVCVRQLAAATADTIDSGSDKEAADLSRSDACGARGFLRHGQIVSAALVVPKNAADRSVAITYTSTMDAVAAVMDAALAAHVQKDPSVAAYAGYARGVLMAHVRASVDVAETSRTGRLVYAADGSSATTGASDLRRRWAALGIPMECRQGLRQLFAALDRALGDTDLLSQSTPRRTLVVAAPCAGSAGCAGGADDGRVVRVTAGLQGGSRFCRVFEAVRLTLQLSSPLDGDGVAPRGALRVSLGAAREWLVAGASQRCESVAAGASYPVEFVLVPLVVGVVRLPPVRVVSEEDALAVRALVAVTHAAPCVLGNPAAPTVFTVPVLAS